MWLETMTFEETVEYKIEVLYDFCYLRRKGTKPDPREERVRKMLLACGNENRIDSAIRGVHTGAYTLNELLTAKGF